MPIPEKGGGPPADFADERYGPYARNVFDLWRAKASEPTPLLIFIHGGGFSQGDKRGYWTKTQTATLDAGLAFASVNYRLTTGPEAAPYPAPMHDCARAVQYIRHHAEKFHVDPQRIAAVGPSAGGGIAMWLAFHDDLADRDADDPVARQSSRLQAAIPCGAQSTYDFREIRKIVPGRAYDITEIRRLFGVRESQRWDDLPIDEKFDALLRDASPITHLTRDDCPIYLRYNDDPRLAGDIHDPRFGQSVKAAMDRIGVPCTLRMSSDFDKDRSTSFEQEIVDFLQRAFTSK